MLIRSTDITAVNFFKSTDKRHVRNGLHSESDLLTDYLEVTWEVRTTFDMKLNH